MALKYKMRALEDPSNNYVFWTSDIPDLTGTDAPVSIVNGTATILSVGGELDGATPGPVDFYPIDEYDLVQWKCNQTNIPIINYGTAGTGANLTTASNIRYSNKANPRSIYPCVFFTSNGAYLSTANGVVQPTGDITVSLYLMTSTPNPGGDNMFLCKRYLSVTSGVEPIAALNLCRTNGSVGTCCVPTASNIEFNTAISTYGWTHIGWSRSASTGQYKTYINGVRTNTGTTPTGDINWSGTGLVSKTPGPWRVGFAGTGSIAPNFWYVQDIRIANTVRDEAWFLAMYNHLIGT